ncbi:helix-turn-helix domain-containing protein [Vibrio sp. Vb2110]|uniref:GlxA family transcriptional regulator n=1 Tax=unclassified Vibrio TaxID=2614977 RepID=UPI0023EB9DF0|nr:MULTISPECIES: helix-turn-helix domain-containing protein [unclassified Vibrio]ELA9196635.1 helix-turn-helix domain-containing protein [Vibrio parahaemolyticus]MDF4743140.1 helix-turn-helix domain-containing protein [Vibrio parahaemolyticus]MDG3409871.1 helix-turn-helix domain-containing protein [Vibrio parahaemolyticus]MDW1846403.1 helix-turn-helix domain-containing protein [Vibrio sp. Vb2130]MDW1880522.1 helix-turn-helix domain-containing protein [Vibrio sp. Vb2110]
MERKSITLTALAFADAPTASIFGPIEILSIAANLAGAPEPVVHIVTQCNQPIRGMGGVIISPTIDIEPVTQTDILLIGSIGFPDNNLTTLDEDTIKWLKQFESHGIPIVSIGSGAFVLAKAQMLESRTATTHWHFANMFRDMFPDTRLLVDRRVTCDTNRYCTSGISGYSEVMMLIVEQFFGLSIRESCHQFIFGDADQIQQKALANFIQYRQHNDTLIHQLQDWMHSSPTLEFSVNVLSKRVHLSDRQMKRRFKLATGQTPIQYIQQIRLSIAKDKLEKTKQTIENISHEVGYEDVRYFRELFKKSNDMTPLEYRKRYQR